MEASMGMAQPDKRLRHVVVTLLILTACQLDTAVVAAVPLQQLGGQPIDEGFSAILGQLDRRIAARSVYAQGTDSGPFFECPTQCRYEEFAQSPYFRVVGVCAWAQTPSHRMYFVRLRDAGLAARRGSYTLMDFNEPPKFGGGGMSLAANQTEMRVITAIKTPISGNAYEAIVGYHIAFYAWDAQEESLELVSTELVPIGNPADFTFGWNRDDLRTRLTAGGLTPVLWDC
jgi:hypothetical protein